MGNIYIIYQCIGHLKPYGPLTDNIKIDACTDFYIRKSGVFETETAYTHAHTSYGAIHCVDIKTNLYMHFYTGLTHKYTDLLIMLSQTL